MPPAAQASRTVLEGLADETRSRAWDEPPCLYLVYLSHGRCRIEPSGIPDTAWGERPAHDLAALAALAPRQLAKPGLYAVAFRAEAFEFQGAEPGTARFAELARDSASGAAESRADGREVRVTTAVDRLGFIYDVKVDRATGRLSRGVHAPDPQHGHAGTIVNALDMLVHAMLGVPMPERRHLGME
jgi:hypothetical protein